MRLSRNCSPNYFHAKDKLAPELAAYVKRRARFEGIHPTAKLLGCAVPTVEELISDGRVMRKTVEKVTARVAELMAAEASQQTAGAA